MPYKTKEERNAYAKEVREYRKSIGVCSWCGKDSIAVSSKALCLDCLEKHREKSANKTASMTEEEKEQRRQRNNQTRRQLQAQRRREGLCTMCGKPAYNGYSKCMDHHLYFKRKSAEYRAAKKKGYAEMGLCRICGDECVPGKKFCAVHYQQRLDCVKIARKHLDVKNHTWKKQKEQYFKLKGAKTAGGQNDSNT